MLPSDSPARAVDDRIRVLTKVAGVYLVNAFALWGRRRQAGFSMQNQRFILKFFLLTGFGFLWVQAGIITRAWAGQARGVRSPVPCFHRLNRSTASLRGHRHDRAFLSWTLVPTRSAQRRAARQGRRRTARELMRGAHQESGAIGHRRIR